MNNFRFSIIIEHDKDGYVAFCPELLGCYAQGDTYEKVSNNIKDAVYLHVEERLDSKEELPQSDSISLSTIEVAL